MRHHTFTIPTLAAAILLAGVSSLTAGLTGAIFTTNSTGTVVNGNQYDSPCSVYLDGGPGLHAPAHAAGLPDGDYYFQVTDPSGKTLLSTDKVMNRSFRVSGGVITTYTGSGGPIHTSNLDQNQPGAITIALANSSCPTDFLATPNNGGAYKAWVTPVTSFVGDPTMIDNACSAGCFHGFLPAASKTDNFKVNIAAATFCLDIKKQFLTNGILTPGITWEFDVTDPSGVTNPFFTDMDGDVTICGLAAGPYTVSENASSVVVGLSVNKIAITPSTFYPFTWSIGQPAPDIVFTNQVPLPPPPPA
jgi:hypothetical protein